MTMLKVGFKTNMARRFSSRDVLMTMDDEHSHGFVQYAQDPYFRAMLNCIGVATAEIGNPIQYDCPNFNAPARVSGIDQ